MRHLTQHSTARQAGPVPRSRRSGWMPLSPIRPAHGAAVGIDVHRPWELRTTVTARSGQAEGWSLSPHLRATPVLIEIAGVAASWEVARRSAGGGWARARLSPNQQTKMSRKLIIVARLFA
jgi:hypothetical protein